jgi:molecular chaperone HtpG
METFMIVNYLKKRNDDELATKLVHLGERILKDTLPHLNQITSILVEFDSHDEKHSVAVEDNISKLTKVKLDELSSIELFLLWQSAFLHDIGMALPQYEMNLLELVENNDRLDVSFKENPTILKFKENSYMEIIDLVKNGRLYSKFSDIRDFIFTHSNEEELIRYLASEYSDYQKFRYGFYQELRITDEEVYRKKNKEIRINYIRDTHHKRGEEYIKAIAHLFEEFLGGPWAIQIANDLGKIVRAHCEPFTFIEMLEIKKLYYKSDAVNLQFVANLLRIGDVIHFSDDRASKSLFAEKMISSEISKKHWNSKIRTGLNYNIQNSEDDKRQEIIFTAFCQEPQDYYFIIDYLDWVDQELQNYDNFLRNIRFSKIDSGIESKYDLLLPNKISRENVHFDDSKFTPAPDLKFTIEQKQVLQLLMGVNLYKDKNLSIRELYQNALDACKVSLSKDEKYNGKIRFGISEQSIDGHNRKYFFCHDNGIGMSKYIIENYFLRIGKSYYKSDDFFRENICHNSFLPISQFGIGILSCFMIGDKIEIITKTIDKDIICFLIDGPYERFYYKTPMRDDIEKIDNHGTIVKVFLTDEFKAKYNSDYYEHIRREIFFHQYSRDPRINDKWDNNIYKLLLDTIKEYPSNIAIDISLDNKDVSLLKQIDLSDFSTFSKEDIEIINQKTSDNRWIGEIPDINSFSENSENIEVYQCKETYKGIELIYMICLPKKYFDSLSADLLKINIIFGGNILFDGIIINDNAQKIDLYHQFFSVIINFVGIKPQISIDRKNITDISTEIREIYREIPQYLSNKILELVYEHIKKYELDDKSKSVIWSYLSNQFPFILTNLDKITEKKKYLNFNVSYTNLYLDKEITIDEYFRLDEIHIKRDSFNYYSFTPIQKYLFLGKAIDAESLEINEYLIIIKSKQFSSKHLENRVYRDYEFEDILICSDNWCEEYVEYDLVTELFPIVPKHLFDKIKNLYETRDNYIFTKRAKSVHHYGNTLIGIAHAHPFLIDDRLGISNKENRSHWEKKEPSFIHNFYQFKKNIHLLEFWGYDRDNNPKKTKRDLIFYMFVSPIPLSNEDEIKLSQYVESEPNYVKGVREGWSILVWGNSGEMVIKPGKIKRCDIVKEKPAIIENNFGDYIFSNLDGSAIE